MIAVQVGAAAGDKHDDTAKAADAALRAVKLDPAQVRSTAVKGWFHVSLPAGMDDAGVRRLLNELAAQPGIEAAAPVFVGEFGPMWPTRRVIVRYAAAMNEAERDAIAQVCPGRLEQREWMARTDLRQADARNTALVLDQANAIADSPKTLFAEPDWVYTGRNDLVPNDPFFVAQWGLRNLGNNTCSGTVAGGVAGADVNAVNAWDVTIGDSSIIVGVIDTGIELTHPDLNLAPGVDATGNGTAGGPGNACDNHGTSVAGVISAKINNATGVSGLAPGCRVAPIRVGVSVIPCSVSFSTSSVWMADGINWTVANGVRVTNSSISGVPFATVDAAYDDTAAMGVLHVASTGNNGTSSISYPGTLASVMAVGAIDRDNTRASFSQYGTGIDLVAPGANIATTDRTGAAGYLGDDYFCTSGTSVAAPFVAAAAALLYSRCPTCTVDQVKTAILQSAVDLGAAGYDTEFGYGRLNARAALDMLSPTNDPCGNATNVSAGGTFDGTLVNASNDGTASCGSSATNPDVWYRYVNGSCPTVLTVTTCGTNDIPSVDAGIDTVLAMFGSCGGAQLDCNDDSAGSCANDGGVLLRDSKLSRSLAAGETVLIRVSKFNTGPVGPFKLNVSVSVANDSCATRVPISPGASVPFCNLTADTSGPNEPGCIGPSSNIYGDLWYQYTPGSGGRFTVRTCGSEAGFDTAMAVYTACPAAGGTYVACNDDLGGCPVTTHAGLSTIGAAGVQYIIRVGGYGDDRGMGMLRVYCSADFNLSGAVSVQDIFDFLAAWFSTLSSADFNGVGGVSVQDIFDFLAAWFASCS